MPTFDSLPKVASANKKVDINGLLHVIVVVKGIRDDESVYFEPRCLGRDWQGWSHPTEEAAKEAGAVHLSEVTPAPSNPTVSSVIRTALRR